MNAISGFCSSVRGYIGNLPEKLSSAPKQISEVASKALNSSAQLLSYGTTAFNWTNKVSLSPISLPALHDLNLVTNTVEMVKIVHSPQFGFTEALGYLTKVTSITWPSLTPMALELMEDSFAYEVFKYTPLTLGLTCTALTCWSVFCSKLKEASEGYLEDPDEMVVQTQE